MSISSPERPPTRRPGSVGGRPVRGLVNVGGFIENEDETYH